MVSEIDINLRLLSIAIDCYRLSVYRLTTPGICKQDCCEAKGLGLGINNVNTYANYCESTNSVFLQEHEECWRSLNECLVIIILHESKTNGTSFRHDIRLILRYPVDINPIILTTLRILNKINRSFTGESVSMH